MTNNTNTQTHTNTLYTKWVELEKTLDDAIYEADTLAQDNNSNFYEVEKDGVTFEYSQVASDVWHLTIKDSEERITAYFTSAIVEENFETYVWGN